MRRTCSAEEYDDAVDTMSDITARIEEVLKLGGDCTETSTLSLVFLYNSPALGASIAVLASIHITWRTYAQKFDRADSRKTRGVVCSRYGMCLEQT